MSSLSWVYTVCPDLSVWLIRTIMSLLPFYLLKSKIHWAAAQKNIKMTCVPSKDSDQPGYLPSPDQSTLSAQRNHESLASHLVTSESTDQTGQMPRLIRVFAGCTVNLVVFFVLWQLSSSKWRKWAASRQNQHGLWAQRRLRSAWASAQSDQSLRCLHEEALDP